MGRRGAAALPLHGQGRGRAGRGGGTDRLSSGWYFWIFGGSRNAEPLSLEVPFGALPIQRLCLHPPPAFLGHPARPRPPELQGPGDRVRVPLQHSAFTRGKASAMSSSGCCDRGRGSGRGGQVETVLPPASVSVQELKMEPVTVVSPRAHSRPRGRCPVGGQWGACRERG